MKALFITPMLSCFYVPGRESIRSKGRLLFASRWRKPHRFRLVCYHVPPSSNGPALLAQRLCGLPGDTLQIREGTLYVNGKNIDDQFRLTHIFKVSRETIGSIRHNPRLAYTIPPYTNTLYVSLEDSYVQDNQLPCERYLLPAGLRDNASYSIYKQNWNRDNFGPVKVPANQWFVLDDNRGHATDSRQIGFIRPSSFIGVVL